MVLLFTCVFDQTNNSRSNLLLLNQKFRNYTIDIWVGQIKHYKPSDTNSQIHSINQVGGSREIKLAWKHCDLQYLGFGKGQCRNPLA